MLVQWATDEGEVHYAKRHLSMRGTTLVLHMQMESLGESGWDWHAWEQSGHGQQRYGLGDTLASAKARAEAALDALAGELS